MFDFEIKLERSATIGGYRPQFGWGRRGTTLDVSRKRDGGKRKDKKWSGVTARWDAR